jgi:hypothetical protein
MLTPDGRACQDKRDAEGRKYEIGSEFATEGWAVLEIV